MLYHRSRRVFFTVAIILGSLSLTFAQADLRVNEGAMRIHIQPQGDHFTLVVKLPIENTSGQTITAQVILEVVDPQGKVLSQAKQGVLLTPHSTVLKIPVPPLNSEKLKDKGKGLIWDRLQYSIEAHVAETSSAKPIEGILSVGVITPQLFELHVAGPAIVEPGGRSVMQVRAIQPLTGRSIAGVTIQASLDTDNDDDKPLLPRKAVTNRDGFASLSFILPKEAHGDDSENEIDVKVKGTLDGYSAEANGTIMLGGVARGALSTDKALYRSGQTVHMRLMAFDAGKKALTDQPVTIEIKDPDYTVQYQAHARTSRFGIAVADWQIPDNLRLGSYNIQARFDNNRYESARGYATVKITRYELPTFTVIAKPDHAYYLPGQDAELEVRANYLFGEPVRRGHVRIVEEDHREWNYRDQKWNIDEGETYEGNTDDQGRYTAHLDLSDDHDELKKDESERFRDLHFAAYFTDTSTRRTEQRRFDVRITKDAIHVYFIGEEG